MVCFGHAEQAPRRDGLPVPVITSDLGGSSEVDLTRVQPISRNLGLAFQGPVKVGAFDIDGSIARSWLALPNPDGRTNADVLKPWANGKELTERSKDKWIIDFGIMEEMEASKYEAPFKYVEKTVKPQRLAQDDKGRQKYWWRHGRTGLDFRAAITGKTRYMATVRVAKHRFFVWLPTQVWPDSRLFAIALDDDFSFGVLSSRMHEVWALANKSVHGDGDEGGRPTYNAESCFETFPFPQATHAQAELIAAAGRELNKLRDGWLNPPEWTARIPEVVPLGRSVSPYPDRVITKPGFEIS